MSFCSSGIGFFLGLPLPLFGVSTVFCSSIGSFLGLPLLLFGSPVIISSETGSSISFTGSFIGSTSWILFFILDIFLTPFILTDDGIITGFESIFSLLSVFNNFSLVPDVCSFFTVCALKLLDILLLKDIICWYFGDFSSSTALTFNGKNCAINLNCASVYWVAILLKLSIYFSSFLPNFL